jgi:hypothetical protein
VRLFSFSAYPAVDKSGQDWVAEWDRLRLALDPGLLDDELKRWLAMMFPAARHLTEIIMPEYTYKMFEAVCEVGLAVARAQGWKPDLRIRWTETEQVLATLLAIALKLINPKQAVEW